MPGVNMPSRWGFCFAGNEGAFTEAILGAIHGNSLDYVEIGLGLGHTLAAVRDICVQMPELKWRLFGVDLETYTGDAINRTLMPPEYAGTAEPEEASEQLPCTIATYLCGSTRFMRRCGLRPHFIFIDGCHGFACVRSDFLCAEQIIARSGVVCCHDTDTNCQGQHIQPHCQTGIDVRRALFDLGVMRNARPGWDLICETHGNPSKEGHGCAFFERLVD